MAVRGPQPANPDMHTTKPVYSGDDIALGITFQMQIGDKRTVSVQTHVTRDCEPAVLNALLDKVSTAFDRIDAKYRLAELRMLLAARTKSLGDMMEDASQTQRRWADQWTGKNKRGPFQPDGQQQSVAEAQRKAAASVRMELDQLGAEIARLEKLTG